MEKRSRKAMTNAERQAKWRLMHGYRRACPPGLLPACIPRGGVDLPDLEKSAAATMTLYDTLVSLIGKWLNELGDDISPIDGLKAFALLAPTLESLTILRGRIIEQRGAEACDVTPAQAARPKIEETLELMRSRFNDIKKPKAT
jgi:hypothetical protein